MTSFCFDHDFRAPSVAAVFETYFDPAHTRDQDEAIAIAERRVLDLVDDGDILRRVCHVIPRRQLPAILRPFVTGGVLAYRETATWRRRDHAIDLDIQPSILNGRAQVRGIYTLERRGPTAIHRRYAGDVRVEVPLVSGRIERGIVAEFAASMPIAASVTQAWLDRSVPSMSAFA